MTEKELEAKKKPSSSSSSQKPVSLEKSIQDKPVEHQEHPQMNYHLQPQLSHYHHIPQTNNYYHHHTQVEESDHSQNMVENNSGTYY